MRVPVRELKNHLSEHLKQAQAGEDIIVTTHGTPVVRLSKLNPELESTISDTLDKLAWVRQGRHGKPLGLPVHQRIRMPPGKSLTELLLEERE